MAWIESHQALAGHRKTKRLRRLLGTSLPETIGYLHLFWWWVLEYRDNGDLTGIDWEDIADDCDWPGEPKKLHDSLVQAGFVEPDGVTVHDWYDYAGKLVTRRERNRDRMRAARSSGVEPVCAARATNVPDTCRATNQPTNQPTDTPLRSVSVVVSERFDRLWALLPKSHGSKKKSRERFAGLSGRQQDRCLIAAENLHSYLAAGGSIQYIPLNENFIGGEKARYNDWVDGVPLRYRSGRPVDLNNLTASDILALAERRCDDEQTSLGIRSRSQDALPSGEDG